MPRMSDRTLGLLYTAAMLLLSLAFQYQAKVLAGEIAPMISSMTSIAEKIQNLPQSLLWRLPIVLTLAVFLFVLWLLTLTKLELSVALPLASVALVINAIGSGLLFGESLGGLRIAGVVTVAAGIAMILKS